MADIQEVKRWWHYGRMQAIAVEEQKRRIDRQRERAETTTASMSGMPHGGGVSDKVGDSAGQIADMERDLADMMADLKQWRKKAIWMAHKVQFCRIEFILDYYVYCYIPGSDRLKSLEDVAAEENVGMRTVKDHIKDTMQAMAEIWDELLSGDPDSSTGQLVQNAQKQQLHF